ncbi:MAG: hypothetical protein H0Z24_05295 [Thermosipho sp. (in: Bacteria)]|nr:hypothetical protein [Thermosipho sp. (in: thermotogales)]
MKDVNDEIYARFIKIVEKRTCYIPGSLLEEKIVEQIKRKKRFNITGIAVVAGAIGIFTVLLLFNSLGSNTPTNVNQRPLYSLYENIQQVPEKYEPIINISLVSDGF